MESPQYLLAGVSAELERLALQARTWEPDVDVLLDRIGVQPGWKCLDLGCGAMGILGPLSRRVGPTGKVVGLDSDPSLLAAAKTLVEKDNLPNVDLVKGDAFATGLPPASWELVHARFMVCPLGRGRELFNEMIALTKPGGIIMSQEPDAASWGCYPPHPAFDRLKIAILEAFQHGGGDFSAGLRTFGLLQDAGLQDVRIRAAILALEPGHPYLRLPTMVAASLRAKILESGSLTSSELDRTVRECEEHFQNPSTFGITFTCVQVWGRKT